MARSIKTNEEIAQKIVDEWFPTERGKRPLIEQITLALRAKDEAACKGCDRSDPDGMCKICSLKWRVEELENTSMAAFRVRRELSAMLQCPATWEYIIKTVAEARSKAFDDAIEIVASGFGGVVEWGGIAPEIIAALTAAKEQA